MTGYSVCFIGNSHTAAIWQAWKNRAPAVADGFSLTVFASRAGTLDDLEWRNGALVPKSPELEERLVLTSGGKTRIEIADYDAIVLIAAGFAINLETLVSAGGTVDHLKKGPVENLLSRSCYAAMVEACLDRSMAMELTDHFRSVSSAPILICPRPFRTEKILEEPHYRDHPLLGNAGVCASVLATAKIASGTVAARHGCEILWQEECTVAPSGFTKAEYGVGALRLRSTNREDDGKHMNEDFGLLRLMTILRRLDELSGGRVLAAPASKV